LSTDFIGGFGHSGILRQPGSTRKSGAALRTIAVNSMAAQELERIPWR
jgi:hypothetical protein